MEPPIYRNYKNQQQEVQEEHKHPAGLLPMESI